MNRENSNDGLPWQVVEKAIASEKLWLIDCMDFSQDYSFDRPQQEGFSTHPLSDVEMLRQLAISIVRGSIRAREIISERENGLWTDVDVEVSQHNDERHGKDWHRFMMNVIKEHFLKQKYEVINEPDLNFGRADLGVYRDDRKNTYVEVGTTSLYKTWMNVCSMRESIFLFVPSNKCVIEFKT